MEQPALFHETIEDALGADIAALGGPKKCGAWLFSHLPPDQAGGMVRACLNQERSEKLGPLQVYQVMEKAATASSFATLQFYAHHLGFNVEWIDPKDEADALEREIRDELRAINQRMARLERVKTKLSPVG
jgi:hypothetical protein